MSFLGRRISRRALAALALVALPAVLPLAAGRAQAAEPAGALPSLRDAYVHERYTLANGLEVILQEDHHAPEVAVNVWYHAGSKDEVEGRSGFAHLFEHLMFQGSRNVAEDTFFKHLEEAGAKDVNGTTSTDRTNYYEKMPAHRLELALWLESDRMGFLLDHVNQETFEGQRRVVKNEYRENYDNRPYGFMWHAIAEGLAPKGHPYHHTTIGTPKDLDAAKLSEVHTFFRTFYVPNNATLVLVGDFDKAKVKGFVERYFGSIPRGPVPATHTKPEPIVLERERHVRMDANVALARVTTVWPTPESAAPDKAVLDVVGLLVGSGRASRGYRRLVHDLELAQGISAWTDMGKLVSAFAFDVEVQKGKTPEAALAALDRVLAELAKDGPTDAELERVKNELATGAWEAVESFTNRADVLNWGNDIAGDPAFAATLADRYQAVTREDVKRAMAKYLPKDRRLVLTIRPNPSAPVGGRVVGNEGGAR